jgi:hypothetical protein
VIPNTALSVCCVRRKLFVNGREPASRKVIVMQTTFQKKLATVAQGQYERFHLMRENQEPLSTQIKAYWRGIGLSFPGVGEAWSAVFVSWCVKTAGATGTQFKFASAHSRFVHAAIANAQSNSGVFHGRRPSEYVPKIGDILHNNRAGNHFDFDFAKANKQYKSHSAIVIEVGTDNRGRYLRTIGGNEADSVGMKEVRLTARGFVKNTDGLYISIVETLL